MKNKKKIKKLSKHFRKDVKYFTFIKFGSHTFFNIYFDRAEYLPHYKQVTEIEFNKIIKDKR